ncbi:MDR family MFS transporter [Symbiobacterium thermophilum]|uniref:Efflux transporter n=3 Tax=Symbiobacterium thermophilum TaxID=2734 RepID=Q67MP2_SYMTH|nr:MDR family MFS transporter [Symbiobacterium thermophilum]BAD41051.1 efflux transporter [Symbiobacterium thermophilum IAM 14863]
MRDRRMLTVFALMLASFLTAVDVTIVDTAMPRIVGSLGGFSMLTWLVSAYMLTSTATMPVYGKLADIIGRKRTFTIGAVIFVIGSALCGAAPSMEALILFRALQGLGAGAMQPTVQTILGDIFTPAERAKVQGWFSAVWGFSALAGPLVGGLMVDYLSWRYLFYINLPLGALALYMVWRHFDERVQRRKARVDYLGAVTLTGGMTLLLLVLLTGGSQLPWGSPQILGMAGGAAVLLLLFLWTQGRALDPILPLRLFRIPVIGWGNLSSLMVGGVMYGTSVYLPIWAQGVQGYSATRSGASLLWLSIGWPLAAVLGSRLIVRMGVRPSALLGLGLNVAGSAALVALARTMAEIPEVLLALVTFVIGAGMGFSTLAFILGIQSSVDWAQRGVATASFQFIRTLGGMIWVSAMGGVMNLDLLGRLQRIPGVAARTAAEAGQWANRLLDPAQRAALGPELQAAMQEALADALRNVHLVMLLAAVLSLAAALLLPNLRFAPEKAPQASTAD